MTNSKNSKYTRAAPLSVSYVLHPEMDQEAGIDYAAARSAMAREDLIKLWLKGFYDPQFFYKLTFTEKLESNWLPGVKYMTVRLDWEKRR